jgi:hypothetical protein
VPYTSSLPEDHSINYHLTSSLKVHNVKYWSIRVTKPHGSFTDSMRCFMWLLLPHCGWIQLENLLSCYVEWVNSTLLPVNYMCHLLRAPWTTMVNNLDKVYYRNKHLHQSQLPYTLHWTYRITVRHFKISTENRCRCLCLESFKKYKGSRQWTACPCICLSVT